MLSWLGSLNNIYKRLVRVSLLQVFPRVARSYIRELDSSNKTLYSERNSE